MDQTNPISHTLTLRAYAKVNLALAIGKGDEPGRLHPICSWMHAIELWDEIEIRWLCEHENQASIYALGWKQSAGEDKPVEWDQDSDLAVRAHKQIEAHVGRKLSVQMRVSKSIPAGGGLGGGSSDGAAVLMGLNELFNLGLDHATLIGLAMEIGSDVPFFLDEPDQIPRPAIVQGMGEKITRLEPIHAGIPITLILPGFGCHTGEVYRAFDESVSPDHVFRDAQVHNLAQSSALDMDGLFNDLAAPACAVGVGLGELKEQIERAIGRAVHVSGSGSTLFVIGPPEPGLIARKVGELAPGCFVRETRLC